MFIAPLVNIWVDMVVVVLVFAGLNKLIQHWTIDPYKYFDMKKRSKNINKDMKVLANQQNMAAVKEKQKEAFKLVGEQFRMTQKSMLVMLVIAFPLLWFVQKYYGKMMYNFGLFTVNGFWTYVILGVVISMIVSGLYDKMLMQKYAPDDIKKAIDKVAIDKVVNE